MAALLVLYIVIGAALIALGIFIVLGQKASAERKQLDDTQQPDQRNTSGSART
ncbi:MAG: hypothetical protein JNK82_27285 [Myxococcaceae bacterium]|nr:hypothetical protein [Myxococcaceae bacterium]